MLLSSLIPSMSSSFTGLVVGAISGALAFVAFAFVMVRRRAQERQDTALPQWGLDRRELAARHVVHVPPYAVLPQGDDVDLEALATRSFRRNAAFDPQLSASSLAKMGLHVGPFGQKLEVVSEDEDVDLAELDPTPAVTVSPCIIISDEPKRVHPLGIINSSSFGPLPTDDSPTEIGETFFDVKPNPLPQRPRIRPVQPAAPRYGG